MGVNEDRDRRNTENLELLHFAFRNIVREADEVLRARRLNRAHHRILHFVGRSDEVSMLDLLEILAISRQALHRPLRNLVDQGLVEVRPQAANRRYFSLSLTPQGRRFEEKITGMQRALFADAEATVGEEAMDGWRKVMARLAEGAHGLST